MASSPDGGCRDPFDRVTDLVEASARGEPRLRRSFGFGVGA